MALAAASHSGGKQVNFQEIMKKIILGTSDAWSISRSSQQPSNTAYYIEDCRILDPEFASIL